MNMQVADAVLVQSLLTFLLLGSVAGFVAGMVLLLRPEWLVRASKFGNRWVSTRQMGRSLEQPVNVDRWFYRYGRFSGMLLIAGAVYIIFSLTVRVARADLIAALIRVRWLQAAWVQPAVDTLVLLLIVGSMLALIVGLFLMFRPSLLRDLELGANQRISLRQTLKPVEVQRGNVDQLVFSNVRWAGVVLLGGSVYAFVVLLSWWLRS